MTDDAKSAAIILLERAPRNARARIISATSALEAGSYDVFVTEMGALSNTDPQSLWAVLPQIVGIISRPDIFTRLRPYMEDEQSGFGGQLALAVAQTNPELLVGEPDILRIRADALHHVQLHLSKTKEWDRLHTVSCDVAYNQSPCQAGTVDPELEAVGQSGFFGWKPGKDASALESAVEILVTDDTFQPALTQSFPSDGLEAGQVLTTDLSILVPGITVKGQLDCLATRKTLWSEEIKSGRNRLDISLDENSDCDHFLFSIQARYKTALQDYGIASLSYLSIDPAEPS